MATYRLQNVNASFKGIPLNVGAGLAEDWLEIESDEEAWTKTVGADGFVTRSQNLNQGAKVRFKVLASSPLNDALSGLMAVDRVSGLGSGPFHYTEIGGTTTAHSPEAWILKVPTMSRGKEETEVEWELDCGALEMFLGGRL